MRRSVVLPKLVSKKWTRGRLISRSSIDWISKVRRCSSVTGIMHYCHAVATEASFFSVQPLRPLCLCGCGIAHSYNHRGTENTKVAQRNPNQDTSDAEEFQIATS